MIKPSYTVLILTLCGLGGCGDQYSDTFEDWEAVRRSGSIERGWIPAWLPKQAITIWERHDLDTNAVIVLFDVAENSKFPENIECEDVDGVSPPTIRSSRFPDDLHLYENAKKCDGYYVIRDGNRVFVWQN